MYPVGYLSNLYAFDCEINLSASCEEMWRKLSHKSHSPVYAVGKYKAIGQFVINALSPCCWCNIKLNLCLIYGVRENCTAIKLRKYPCLQPFSLAILLAHERYQTRTNKSWWCHSCIFKENRNNTGYCLHMKDKVQKVNWDVSKVKLSLDMSSNIPFAYAGKCGLRFKILVNVVCGVVRNISV